MQSILVFSIIISLTFSAITNDYPCDCEEIILQADCLPDDGCKWVTVGSDSSCTTEVIDCRKYSQNTCNNYDDCVWKNSVCTEFESCSDLITDANEICASKSYCTDGSKIGDPCIDVKCSNLLVENKCNNAQESDSLQCIWSNNVCKAIDTISCSTITDQQVCEDQSCYWNKNTCQALTCADITKVDDCLSVLSDDFLTITICQLNGTICQDAVDTSNLTKDNCYEYTQDYFAWDGSACTACKDDSSYPLLFVTITLYISVLFH